MNPFGFTALEKGDIVRRVTGTKVQVTEAIGCAQAPAPARQLARLQPFPRVV